MKTPQQKIELLEDQLHEVSSIDSILRIQHEIEQLKRDKYCNNKDIISILEGN